MGKADKMIEAQKEESKFKVEYVKQIVDEMVKEGIAITNYSVWKKSGLSKGFIYQNEEVKEYIEKFKSEKSYNYRKFSQIDVYERKINDLEKEVAYLKRLLRNVQKENLESLYFENKVMKRRLEVYEELEKQGIIERPNFSEE